MITIYYNCSKCNKELETYIDDVSITAQSENRNDVVNQDYDILDYDCPNCSHENFLKIYVEVE